MVTKSSRLVFTEYYPRQDTNTECLPLAGGGMIRRDKVHGAHGWMIGQMRPLDTPWDAVRGLVDIGRLNPTDAITEIRMWENGICEIEYWPTDPAA